MHSQALMKETRRRTANWGVGHQLQDTLFVQALNPGADQRGNGEKEREVCGGLA
jgi:hypothetical protein